MNETSDFNLVIELFDNIALVNGNCEVIYLGRSLSKILNNQDLDLTLLNIKNDEKIGELKLVLEAIKTIHISSKPVSIKFTNSKDEFLLFKATNSSDQLFIFGLRTKINEIKKIEFALQNRVKELECLFNTSKKLDSYTNLHEVLDTCAKLIEEGFQYQEATIVNIELGKKIYGNSNWKTTEVTDIFTSEILLSGEKKGEIRIYIKNGLQFLDEEKRLVNEIAKKISRIIEKEERTNSLEKQQKILTAKNEALLKLTEECYQKRENLRTFFSAITNKIIVIDNDFNIIMSNKEEIGDTGKCYQKLFNFKQRCENCTAVETFNTAKDVNCIREDDGLYYSLGTHPILGIDGKVERVLEVCMDITQQKTMEAQLIQSYKLASLGKLVAGVAHEINNPNTFILGNLKIVQEAFEDIFPILDKHYTEQKDLKIARLNYEVFKDNINILVRDMINGAKRTKKIVGDLRNFAKKDEGVFADDVDLNEIIKNNLSLTQKHIKKVAQLELDLKESLPSFKGSNNKMEQVLLNLTMNASEAIENDNGVIKIKTDYDEKYKEVILIVSDNGVGMNEATLKSIFDPFFTTKREKGGTGLGLSITYGIIKDHNGKIDVSSKIGYGTTFTTRIPIKPSE